MKKIQLRCCQSSGAPPEPSAKKIPSKLRSISSIVSAASMIGPITSISQEPIAAAQEKTGSRRQAMPGARILRSVVVRSIAIRTKPSVARPVAEVQASTPSLARKASSESGGSGLIPASEGVKRKPE